MTVMCIKQGQWKGVTTGGIIKGPEYGEFCNVVHTRPSILAPELHVHIIKEYPLSNEGGFDVRQFIPCSDQTEHIEEHHLELAN